VNSDHLGSACGASLAGDRRGHFIPNNLDIYRCISGAKAPDRASLRSATVRSDSALQEWAAWPHYRKTSGLLQVPFRGERACARGRNAPTLPSEARLGLPPAGLCVAKTSGRQRQCSGKGLTSFAPHLARPPPIHRPSHEMAQRPVGSLDRLRKGGTSPLCDIKIPSHTACKLLVQIAVNRLTVAGKPPELDVPFAPLIGLSKAALPASNITQHSQEAHAGVGGRPQGTSVDAPRVFIIAARAKEQVWASFRACQHARRHI